jgi:hypothetical protein
VLQDFCSSAKNVGEAEEQKHPLVILKHSLVILNFPPSRNVYLSEVYLGFMPLQAKQDTE